MSEEKQIEQEIGWYKVVFAIFMATDVSLVAWLFQNFKVEGMDVLFPASCAGVLLTIILALINRRVFKLLGQLKRV